MPDDFRKRRAQAGRFADLAPTLQGISDEELAGMTAPSLPKQVVYPHPAEIGGSFDREKNTFTQADQRSMFDRLMGVPPPLPMHMHSGRRRHAPMPPDTSNIPSLPTQQIFGAQPTGFGAMLSRLLGG